MRTYRAARIATAGALVALTACSAPTPSPELLTADGVERVSVDRADYAAELRSFRTSAFGLGEALLADGGDGSRGKWCPRPRAC